MDKSLTTRDIFVEDLVYHIDYLLEKSPNANCNIPNELILNNTGDYYEYTPENTIIDGKSAPLTLNTPGSLDILNALNQDRRLQIIIKYTKNHPKLRYIPIDRCINTQYGFKLSEVIGGMETFSGKSKDDYEGKTNGAHLTIVQDGFVKDNKIVFNFYIKNTGSQTARNVLFKDILPSGVHLKLGGIYINGCHAYPEYVNIEGSLLIIKLQDIVKGNSETLTIVCDIDRCLEIGQVNIGCIVYISSYVLSRRVDYTVKIIQSISNAKGIDTFMKC